MSAITSQRPDLGPALRTAPPRRDRLIHQRAHWAVWCRCRGAGGRGERAPSQASITRLRSYSSRNDVHEYTLGWLGNEDTARGGKFLLLIND